jgi:hypothetical protein
MMKSAAIAPSLVLLLLLGFAPPAVVLSQGQPAAPAAANPVRAGRVFISGEKPVIRLLDKADGTALTQVSFWRVHWSPVGRGHVCYLTVGEPGAAGSVRVALFDNRKLFDYLTNEMLGTFNKSYVDQPFTPIGGATFGSSGDSTTEHREVCRSDTYNVELVWRGLQTPGLIDIQAGSRPANPFGLTYLRIPATSAAITVNGKPASGQAFPAPTGGNPSAFLAFGETWLK